MAATQCQPLQEHIFTHWTVQPPGMSDGAFAELICAFVFSPHDKLGAVLKLAEVGVGRRTPPAVGPDERAACPELVAAL